MDSLVCRDGAAGRLWPGGDTSDRECGYSKGRIRRPPRRPVEYGPRPRDCGGSHSTPVRTFCARRSRAFACRGAAFRYPRRKPRIPRGRAWNTCSLKYPGSVRSFHSCTHKSEQNVKRPLGVSCRHQRQRFRPCGPFVRRRRSTRPPFWVRLVLVLSVSDKVSAILLEIAESGTPGLRRRLVTIISTQRVNESGRWQGAPLKAKGAG